MLAESSLYIDCEFFCRVFTSDPDAPEAATAVYIWLIIFGRLFSLAISSVFWYWVMLVATLRFKVRYGVLFKADRGAMLLYFYADSGS